MYSILLPIRFFLRRKVTILAVLAVALCVFTVMVVMTVMDGLVNDFTKKNHAFYSDCVVSTDSLVGFGLYEEFIELLKKQDHVKAASPVINTFGLVQAESVGRNAALNLMGIDIGRHIKTTNFADGLHYNIVEPEKAFELKYDPNLSGCIFGVDLLVERTERGNYTQLAYLPDWSYVITCFPLTPKGAVSRIGRNINANSKTFSYSDNSNSGLAKVDSGTVYLPFDSLQSLCGMDAAAKRASAIFIKFQPNRDIDISTKKTADLWQEFVSENQNFTMAGLFDSVSVQDWKSYRRAMIAPMEKERTMLLLLFLLVGLITVFIIFVIFYMIISRKSKDIGVLKSLGISKIGILNIFLRVAFLIGICGSAIGISAALVFLVNVNRLEGWLFSEFGFQMWDREIYAIGDIPSNAGLFLTVSVGLCAIVACLIGAFLPTFSAAGKKCVDILRVNQM